MYGNIYVIVVIMKNIILNWYIGEWKVMFIFNCFFCVGGVVIFFLNKRKDKRVFKYKLYYVVRMYKGVDDNCYKCVF